MESSPSTGETFALLLFVGDIIDLELHAAFLVRVVLVVDPWSMSF